MVAAEEAGDCGFMQRMELRFHLFMCRHCRDYIAQIRSIGQGARDLAGDSAPDPRHVRRLEKKICDEIRRHRPDSAD
jgi:hypothetical protein